MITTVKQNENGDLYIEIPQEILDSVGWKAHNVLSMVVIDGLIHISRKTDWTVDQVQEGDNLENIIDDVVHNNSTHKILHDGNVFAICPIK